MSHSTGGKLSRLACKAALVAIVSIVSSAAIAGDTSNYTYDALGRVIQVSRTSTAANSTTSAYAYDAAGNRTNVTVSGAAAGDPNTGQGASVPPGVTPPPPPPPTGCGGACRYFMPPIAGFAPISY